MQRNLDEPLLAPDIATVSPSLSQSEANRAIGHQFSNICPRVHEKCPGCRGLGLAAESGKGRINQEHQSDLLVARVERACRHLLGAHAAERTNKGAVQEERGGG